MKQLNWYQIFGETIPNGQTVLPTDDVTIWLKCGAITDRVYTTVAEVLADTTCLYALITSNNATDYLVRSTSFATEICADQTAMTYIGQNEYCMTTLLADPTWHNAFYNSPCLNKEIAYSGTIVPYTAIISGIYKLEVWGARGGSSYGALGGYSYGNISLNAGDTIYVCVGGTTSTRAGGYNGGGTGGVKDSTNQPYGGGGATHIGKTNALLKNTAKADVYIVAGGGGGYFYNEGQRFYGGTGGGTSGGSGGAAGGTQTSGAAYGAGGNSGNIAYASGGGAGLYGGYANYGGGGGGSGYIGGCISGTASTQNGVQAGHGKAAISYVGAA